MCTRSTAFALIVLILGPAAYGSLLDPVSIARECHVDTHIPEAIPHEDDSYGNGVEPYSSTVSVRGAHASQTSTISPETISFVGHAYAVGGLSMKHETYYGADAYSSLVEQFIVTSQSPFTLSFTWNQERMWNSQRSWVSLIGPLGEVFWKGTDRNTQKGTWTYAGILEPGQYTYEVQCRAHAQYSGKAFVGDIDATATLSLLPEPNTAILFILAMIPLAGRARTKQSTPVLRQY